MEMLSTSDCEALSGEMKTLSSANALTDFALGTEGFTLVTEGKPEMSI